MSSEASEWAQWSPRAKRAVQRKRMRERCERTSERTSEWPSALRIDFIFILATGEHLCVSVCVIMFVFAISRHRNSAISLCVFACMCLCARACVCVCLCVFRHPSSSRLHYLVNLSFLSLYLSLSLCLSPPLLHSHFFLSLFLSTSPFIFRWSRENIALGTKNQMRYSRNLPYRRVRLWRNFLTKKLRRKKWDFSNHAINCEIPLKRVRSNGVKL